MAVVWLWVNEAIGEALRNWSKFLRVATLNACLMKAPCRRNNRFRSATLDAHHPEP